MELIDELYKRILDISIKNKLGHLGSCFTTLPILVEIYTKKKPDDIVVLSNGHAGVALYVVLEKFLGVDAEKLLHTHGIHPCRDIDNGIVVSTGSLGLGITVATGLAVGNKDITVHCIISDGECAEGSVWESLRFIEDYPVNNIEVYCNANGWSAYQKQDTDKLERRLISFLPRINFRRTDVNSPIEWINPLSAHYTTANEEMLQQLK